jgi:hypothetical protein
MIEELARLVDTSPTATVELLERMFDANTPNYDMDDKLKGLLQKLYDIGFDQMPSHGASRFHWNRDLLPLRALDFR